MSNEISAAEEIKTNKVVELFTKKDYFLKKLIFFIGIIAAFTTGLLFVLLGDVLLSCESTWLIGAIIFAFGSGAFAVLSDIFKEKLVLKYLFKGLALAFLLGFLGLLIGFYLNKATTLANNLKGVNTAIFIVTLILTVITVICQALDIILTATIKEK